MRMRPRPQGEGPLRSPADAFSRRQRPPHRGVGAQSTQSYLRRRRSSHSIRGATGRRALRICCAKPSICYPARLSVSARERVGGTSLQATRACAGARAHAHNTVDRDEREALLIAGCRCGVHPTPVKDIMWFCIKIPPRASLSPSLYRYQRKGLYAKSFFDVKKTN